MSPQVVRIDLREHKILRSDRRAGQTPKHRQLPHVGHGVRQGPLEELLRSYRGRVARLDEVPEIFHDLMEPRDFLAECVQHARPPHAAHEQRPRVSEHAGDVSHQLVRRPHVHPRMEIRVRIRCVTEGLLGPIGNRAQEVPEHRSLGHVPRHIIQDMALDTPVLQGRHVRLEPLERRHIDGLVVASAGDPPLYQWSPVPQGAHAAAAYVETALAGRAQGKVVPFAIVRAGDGVIIGSSRFFDIEQWAWPSDHPRHGRTTPDVCEIGYTWLARSAVRTGANTEAKLLMLTHAFEAWDAVRVCFHTDVRNDRSRAALQRIGGQFEGILRGHRMAADFIPRDSVRFSIVASEWPAAKQRLEQLLHPR